jgi:enamine deaminase RidA (YjgF/YER057c/UK114 family)
MGKADLLLTRHVEPGASASRPSGAYAAFAEHGSLLFTSGVVARHDGEIITSCIADDSLTLGERAVRLAVSAILLGLQERLESLDKVAGVVALNGYLRTGPSFVQHVRVMNAGSLLIQQVFPDLPPPARTTVGVATLPGNGMVEVSMTVALH